MSEANMIALGDQVQQAANVSGEKIDIILLVSSTGEVEIRSRIEDSEILKAALFYVASEI